MIISPDDYLWTTAGYLWSEEAVTRAWARTRKEVEHLLPRYDKLVLLIGLPAAGKTTWLWTPGNEKSGVLYVDATFVKRKWRAPFIELAAKAGKPIEAIIFDTPWETILERNALRPPTRTPPVPKLEGWREALITSPPTEEEGFSKVITVRP